LVRSQPVIFATVSAGVNVCRENGKQKSIPNYWIPATPDLIRRTTPWIPVFARITTEAGVTKRARIK